MSITHSFKEAWTRSSGDLIGGNKAEANSSELNFDVSVPAGKTNHINFRVYLKQLKSIYITSTQNVTLKTNTFASPQETIALKASSGTPMDLFWERTTGYFTIPFAGDLTQLHFTNGGSSEATVKVRASLDLTKLVIQQQDPPDVPNGSNGVAYTSTTFTATGGIGTYAWSVATGSLPTGLSLNASTGVLSGTPSAAGMFTFTIRVTDQASTPATDDLACSVTIAA